MIIEKEYPVYEKMKNHADWELVFENNLSGVFIPKKDIKDKYLYPIVNDEYYNKTIFSTNLK